MIRHFSEDEMIEILLEQTTQAQRQELLDHVQTCPDCQQVYQELTSTLTILQRWEPHQPTARQWTATLKNLESELARERPKPAHSPFRDVLFSPTLTLSWVRTAIIFCIGMLAGFYLTHTLQATTVTPSVPSKATTPQVEQKQLGPEEKTIRLPTVDRDYIELSEFDSRTLPDKPKMVMVRARVKDSGQLIYWNFKLNGGE